MSPTPSGKDMNKLEFSGRNAVVTGGAAGIGLAIAQRLVQSGARVSIWDRDAAALTKARELLGGSTHVAAVDVTSEPNVQDAFALTLQAVGKVDALVCSAGITGPNATV